MTEEELQTEASRILKALLVRRQLKHADLVDALSRVGVNESVVALKGSSIVELSVLLGCLLAVRLWDLAKLPLTIVCNHLDIL